MFSPSMYFSNDSYTEVGCKKAEEDDTRREKAAGREKWKEITAAAGQQYMN